MFAVKSCLDLKIYNQEGESVLTIDYANRAKIVEDLGCAYLMLEHEINDFKLLELMYGDGESDKKSDFQKDLGEVKISFGRKRNPKEYKAIGRFTVTTAYGKEEEVKLVFNRITFNDTDRRKNDFIDMQDDKISVFKTKLVALLDDKDNFFTLVK